MDGILLFKKPILWTSHDAVDFTRRRIGQKAVGHAGTLDPMATGLLVLLLGKATKLSQQLMGLDKDYVGTMSLGITTETHDMEGTIVEEKDFAHVSEAKVSEIFAGLKGAQQQMPPAYSAARLKGKKLYQWARQGIAVQPQAKEIVIHEFLPLRIHLPDIFFFMTCSKGTYVRSLCDLTGKKLGCGATLASLVRTRIGPFLLKDAFDETQLQRTPLEEVERCLINHKPSLS